MRRVGGVAALLAVAFVFAGCQVQTGKHYSFSKVLIDATVLPDGSMNIVERRTFDFHGSFTYAYYDLSKTDFARIEDFRILEHGQRLVAVAITPTAEGKFHAVWSYSAEDEQRTFTIAYRVRCAVDAFQDTGHLLWQFIGDGWGVPSHRVRVTVHIPGTARRTDRPGVACPRGHNDETFQTRPLQPRDIRAWGHGPFNGNVSIPDPQTVVLTVNDLPPNLFVEGSIVFPNRSVPAAYLQPKDQLPAILANEQRLANDTNKTRHRHVLEHRWVWILYGLYPLILLLILVLAFWRDRVKGVPRYLQEPPKDTHPVELAYLWAAYRGHFSPSNAYRAQLLHLAWEGAIDVSAVGQVSKPEDITVYWKKEPTDELDKDFVEFLFGTDGKKPVSLKDIKATGDRRTRLLQWTKDATSKTKDVVTRIRKGKSRLESHVLLVVSGLTAWFGYFATNDVAGDHVGLGLIPLAIVGWLVAHRILPPRPSKNMRERIAKWKAFRRFLKRFSHLPDAPALAVVIWEKYLVYAVALGVAKEVEKQVRALVAEEDLPEAWPGVGRGWQGYWLSQQLYSAPVAHAVAAAATSSGWSSGWGSSSSGGGFSGGGFSGGGGGGGGGSGGGAG